MAVWNFIVVCGSVGRWYGIGVVRAAQINCGYNDDGPGSARQGMRWEMSRLYSWTRKDVRIAHDDTLIGIRFVHLLHATI